MENRKLDSGEKLEESSSRNFATWLKNKRLVWIPALAVLVILALIFGLLVATEPSDDEESAPEAISSETRAPQPSEEPDETLDSDSDGLPDVVEIKGWKTAGGKIYRTDPDKADTDSDGLSDSEEAGELISGDGLKAVYAGLTDPTKVDSDLDGLDDRTEVLGWTTARGEQFFTDPMNPDSDGDGLEDGVEAGIISEDTAEQVIYSGLSDPTKKDTDGDGLDDLAEVDNETDPYLPDTDGDGLSDQYEVEAIGTDPLSQDTDNDGLDDRYEDEHREDEGLDPLFVNEPRMSKKEYALEFAKGAFAGDAAPGDSLAWLSGNLMSVGAGFIPVLGWAFGTLMDLRDIVANVIQRDWVAASFNLVGLVPYGGDTVNASRKVMAFVTDNPHLIAGVGAVVATHRLMPENIKIQIFKKMWKSWDALIAEGSNQAALFKLQKSGQMNLDSIHATMKRPGHVKGKPVPFLSHWSEGEALLEESLKRTSLEVSTQTYMSTQGCRQVCNSVGRSFDVLADGVAHESKVGYVSLTERIRAQINSDAYFKEQGLIEGAHWHFYPSEKTGQISASKQVIDLLEEKGIEHTVHPPKI